MLRAHGSAQVLTDSMEQRAVVEAVDVNELLARLHAVATMHPASDGCTRICIDNLPPISPCTLKPQLQRTLERYGTVLQLGMPKV